MLQNFYIPARKEKLSTRGAAFSTPTKRYSKDYAWAERDNVTGGTLGGIKRPPRKGCTAYYSQVTSSVPQVLILSIFLFIIYINDIDKLPLLSPATRTHYADEILHIHAVQSNINLNTLWISSYPLTVN